MTAAPAPHIEHLRLSAKDQLAALQSHASTAEEQARAFLDQHKRVAGLNAFISIAEEQHLLAQANESDRRRQQGRLRSSLDGLLVCVKDNIHVAGFANTAGTPALGQFRPAADAAVIATLRARGVMFAGKTNMHELAFGITSANKAFGPVRNPAAPEKFAGGSSGGTAAAIAAGLVAAGLGTDTGGSARIPAALCGIAGFRPASGRYAASGVTPISKTRDTIGLLASTVEDIALLDGAITGQDASLPPRPFTKMRFGICSYYFDNIDGETGLVIDAALGRLKRTGAELVDVRIPDIAPLMEQSAFAIAMYEVARELPGYLADYDTGVEFSELQSRVASEDVKALLDLATGNERVSDQTYAAALASKRQLAQVYRHTLRTHGLTALIMPTAPLPSRDIAVSLDTVDLNGARVATFPTYIRNAEPATIAGLPSLTVPAGRTRRGLPIGLMLDGLEDREVLATGAAIEKLLAPA